MRPATNVAESRDVEFERKCDRGARDTRHMHGQHTSNSANHSGQEVRRDEDDGDGVSVCVDGLRMGRQSLGIPGPVGALEGKRGSLGGSVTAAGEEK